MTEHTRKFLETHRHWKARLFFVLMSLFGVVIILGGVGTGKVLAGVLDAKDELLATEEAVKKLDFETAGKHLELARSAISDARRGFIFLAPLRIVPVIGSRVAGLAELFKTADERLLPTLIEVVGLADDIISTADEANVELDRFSDVDIETRVELLSRLSQRRDDLEKTAIELALLTRDLEELSKLPLPRSLEQILSSFQEKLPVLQRQVEFLSVIAVILPEFGGLQEQKHFLILFENNDELRAGGGFIGTLGDLTVLNGEVVSLSTQDVYAMDGPVEQTMRTEPPQPLEQYLNVPAWFLRDANWSPDGPTSAKKALELFAIEEELLGRSASKFDGVIVFTPDLVSDILSVLGPITVEGQMFTAENIHEALNYEVGKGYVEKGLHPIQRKEIIGTLTKEIVGRLMEFPLSSWGEIIAVVDASVEEKQLYLFSTDKQMQERVERVGWAGQLLAEGENMDVLMVVDANLGSLKTDPVVNRQIRYRVRQNSKGRLIASVSILYDHQGEFDWNTTRYRTYTRVYVPQGSELLRATGTLIDDKLKNPQLISGPVETTEELGFTVFGAFTAVEPTEQQTLEFVYYLPKSFSSLVDEGLYSLTVFKQLGAQKNALTIDVDFGKPVLTAVPAEEESQFGDTRYFLNTILDQDLSVYVRQKIRD